MEKPITKPSEYITSFLNFLSDIQRSYDVSYDAVNDKDLLRSDLYHKIEDENTDYAERCKVATQLATCLRDRRYYKDRVEEAEPIVAFIDDNKRLIKDLEELLGKVRKIEKHHETRFYVPRVLKDEKIM
jgi:5'-deoxynucleotidase YfbR-like HD superfamily hydrolase